MSVLRDVSCESLDLPLDEFLLVSSKTPLINVDLLIEDEGHRLLLSWRDDEYSGTGWHIIGGIIRLGETMETRLRKTAKNKIGFIPSYDIKPCKITEFIFDQKYRSHYISHLYHCRCKREDVTTNETENLNIGDLRWFDHVPDKLIWAHEGYRGFLEDFLHGYKEKY